MNFGPQGLGFIAWSLPENSPKSLNPEALASRSFAASIDEFDPVRAGSSETKNPVGLKLFR